MAIMMVALLDLPVCGQGQTKYLPTGVIQTLDLQSVANDLKLTPEQRDQVESLVAARRTAMMNLGAALNARANDSKALIQAHKEALADLEIQALSILRPAQRTRLDQVGRQFAALRGDGTLDGSGYGLTSKTVEDALNLNETQKRELREKSREIQKSIEEKLAKLRKEMQQVVVKGKEELLGVLSKEQRMKYLELFGPEIDLANEK